MRLVILSTKVAARRSQAAGRRASAIRHLRSATCLSLLLFAASAQAGVVYRFSSTFTSHRGEVRASGRVWAEGDRYRVEVYDDAQRPRQIAISNNGDRTAAIFNSETKEWTPRQRTEKVRSSMYFDLPWTGSKITGPPLIAHEDGGDGGIVAGRATRKHTIDIGYALTSIVEKTPVTGTVKAKLELWVVESLPRLPLDRPLRTGFSQIDPALDEIFAKIGGMVVRSELTVSRTIADGEALTEKAVTTVDDLQQASIDPLLFAIPEEVTRR